MYFPVCAGLVKVATGPPGCYTCTQGQAWEKRPGNRQSVQEEDRMNTRAEKALEYHKKGYNCAQAVACSFCEEFGVDEETMFRVAEGFGLGMGMMDMCGAVTGMMMVIGMENSVGSPDNGKLTKADTYKKVREYAARFKDKNSTYYCRELKGTATGKPIVSCDQCILDAVALTEEYLDGETEEK